MRGLLQRHPSLSRKLELQAPEMVTPGEMAIGFGMAIIGSGIQVNGLFYLMKALLGWVEIGVF